eukprot:1139034-Pelagomonas_calceolata.AAC.1
MHNLAEQAQIKAGAKTPRFTSDRRRSYLSSFPIKTLTAIHTIKGVAATVAEMRGQLQMGRLTEVEVMGKCFSRAERPRGSNAGLAESCGTQAVCHCLGHGLALHACVHESMCSCLPSLSRRRLGEP